MSPSFDPYYNLALEELLLSHLGERQCVLYLWQNQRTVVIGRHQNAWRECLVDRIETAGGRIARRLSGGGAVYHDLGNLNFTFLVPREAYDLHRQLKVILTAVRELGIEAEFSGRNDILAAGRKFSGNAFYHGQQASFHHGTILLDVDLSILQDYLNVPPQKLAAKGVASVKSRVINLRELVPGLTIEHLKTAMQRAFLAEYGGGGEVMALEPLTTTPEFIFLMDKYASWDWRLGKTPAFDVIHETRFPWGGIELGLVVVGGKVTDAKIFSDAMDVDVIDAMVKSLIGIAYSRQAASNALSELANYTLNPLTREVAEWLSTAE
ncbi:MAG: Lipoate-protein ligase A [Firmicutes bacterium]|nr:Lipoate-protein ligase A [candidate division NPL-UPA2 bacterium]MBT9156170.1 Lipoate-protein ligase A [candidate division NPL-UPA2 bacterium]